MTAHSRLLFAHHMNDQFDRTDGLGAARLQRRFTSGRRSTSSLNIMQIGPSKPASTRYAVVLDALRRAQARQLQPVSTRVTVKSP